MIIAHYSILKFDTKRVAVISPARSRHSYSCGAKRNGAALHLPPPFTVTYNKPVTLLQILLPPSEEIVAGDAPPRNDITTNNSLPPAGGRKPSPRRKASKAAEGSNAKTQSTQSTQRFGM